MSASLELYWEGKFGKASAAQLVGRTLIGYFILSLSRLHANVSGNSQCGENQTTYYLNMWANESAQFVMAQIPVVLEMEIN